MTAEELRPAPETQCGLLSFIFKPFLDWYTPIAVRGTHHPLQMTDIPGV